MTDAADVALDGLAVARITLLLTGDKISERPRAALKRWSRQHLPESAAEYLIYLEGCPWCVGMYVGAGAALARDTRLWRLARYPLAMGAIAGIVGSVA